jgi:hypothetical protein
MADLAVQTLEIISPAGANSSSQSSTQAIFAQTQLIVSVSPTVPTPTGATQTIATNTGTISRVNPAGACTAAIAQKGSTMGQLLIIANLSQTVANTITFDFPANSNVWDDGTNPPVIKAGTAKWFYWDTSINTTGAWVPVPPFAG